MSLKLQYDLDHDYYKSKCYLCTQNNNKQYLKLRYKLCDADNVFLSDEAQIYLCYDDHIIDLNKYYYNQQQNIYQKIDVDLHCFHDLDITTELNLEYFNFDLPGLTSKAAEAKNNKIKIQKMNYQKKQRKQKLIQTIADCEKELLEMGD